MAQAALPFILLLHFAAAASAAVRQVPPPVEPGAKLYARMADLIVPYGYPLEEHFVETVDGYILRLFRIPHGRRTPHGSHQQSRQQHTVPHLLQQHSAHLQPTQRPAASKHSWRRSLQHTRGKGSHSSHRHPGAAAVHTAPRQHHIPTAGDAPRPVVHIQHGLLGSSTDFLLNGPGLSLPLILADAGYDVFLGNVRGNVFSRNHSVLDVLDAEFWQFSWDDMAARDLPAMLTHELMLTNAAHIAYIGHSQGTTIIMAFLSTHAGSALAEHIQVAILLAPVAFVTHMDSLPMNALAALDTDEIFTLMGFHEFMPSSEVLSKLEGQLCKVQPYLCVNLLSALCGYNPKNLNIERLPIYLNYTPSGTSVKNMAKWAQAVRSVQPDVLRMFDYGTACRSYLDLPQPCNQAVYGHQRPPAYNFSNIQTPMVLFTGGQDVLADPQDTVILLRHLPKVQAHHHEPDYGHLDFIWGYNAVTRVYARVVEVLQADPGSAVASTSGAGPTKPSPVNPIINCFV